MPRKQPIYSAYARHYDALGQRRFGEVSARSLLTLLGQRDIAPASVLDLACGTGAATFVFAEMGLAATGLDFSADMLAVARERAATEGVQIEWILDDITTFRIDRTFDLVTCFYDAVNYLPNRTGVLAFLRRAFAAVSPGGILAFDINTRRKLRERWHDMTVVVADTDDRYIVYQSWYDEGTDASPLVVNMFERGQDGNWTRHVEEHIEYAFSVDDVTADLADAGFQDINVIEWQEGEPEAFREGTEASFRVLFVANKPTERT